MGGTIKFWAGLMLLVVTVPVGAKSIMVGPHQVAIHAPKGHCYLNRDRSTDQSLFDYFRKASSGENELLMITAECNQLEKWREGNKVTLDSYSVAMAPKVLVERKAPLGRAEYIEKITAGLKKRGAKIFREKSEKVAQRIKKKVKTIEVQRTKWLGILERTDNAVYLGQVQKMKTEAGKSKTQVGVMAFTLVNRKAINLHLWRKYSDQGTIARLMSQTKAWVADVYASN